MIINQFRSLIEDFRFYSECKKYKFLTFLNLNLYINILFRISHIFYHYNMFPIAKLFWLIQRLVFCVDIDPGAKLSGGLQIIHGIGIVIGRNVRSLGRLTIYHGATIGGNNNKVRVYNGFELSQPLIEENVTIGIHSAVLGPILVGKNSKIGVNAIVTKDVEPNSIMISNNKSLVSLKN